MIGDFITYNLKGMVIFMGNTWEEKSRKTIRKGCPCGGGYFYINYIVVEDDYLREREETETGCTCDFCSKRVILIGDKFQLKKVSDFKKEFKYKVEKLENELKDELYEKYITKLRNSFSSKKKLYEFLYNNSLVYICCSLNTFYKNGEDYYIGKNDWKLDKIQKALELLDILEKEDNEKISELKNKIQVLEINHKEEVKTLIQNEKEELMKQKEENKNKKKI